MKAEALPDDANTFKALHYVQGQAAKGHFKGHSTALLVLYYLVTNMWVRPSDDGTQGRGEVVRSRAGIGDIAAGTALCRRAVQHALAWLAEAEWIDIQRSADATGRETRQYIYLKLDVSGHRERERSRVVDHNREGARRATPGVHQMPPRGVHQVPPLNKEEELKKEETYRRAGG